MAYGLLHLLSGHRFGNTWRIIPDIPVSKWLVSPIYKPCISAIYKGDKPI